MPVLLALVSSGVQAAPAEGQRWKGPPPTEYDCTHAARIVKNEQPAKRMDDATRILSQCSGSIVGETAESVIRAMKSEKDVDTLQSRLVPFTSLRDARYLAANLEISRDAGASVPARLVAMATLVDLVSDFELVVPALKMTEQGEYCDVSSWDPVVPVRDGAPLPSGYRQTILDMFRELSASEAAPQEVRRAAACGAYHAEREVRRLASP
ncbi:MAG TPA: hypothetical protein VGE02_12570 [Gemmatimonadales bacterium]